METTPILARVDRDGLVEHFESAFSAETFLDAWTYLDGYLDLETMIKEDTPEDPSLGVYFCKSKYSLPPSIHQSFCYF